MMLRNRHFDRAWVTAAVLAVLAALLGAATIWLYFQRATTAEDNERQAKAETAEIAKPASDLATDVIAACKNDKSKRLSELGLCGKANRTQTTIEEADTPTPTTGAVGPVGPAAPFTQVLAAVRMSLGDALTKSCGGSCVGRAGADAPAPTEAQLAAVVAGYCGARNNCTPPKPADGKDGTNGTNGADGAKGDPGRGIVSGPTCNDDGTWTTTFDSPPLTETQPGPCRVLPVPDPEPTE